MQLNYGLTGQGMGEGILKESVPEAKDYVIAVISEEYGSLVSISVLLIFFYIFHLELLKIVLTKKINF